MTPGSKFDWLIESNLTAPDLSPMREEVEGKSIVITGAGGSIGFALSETIFKLRPRQLILLELSEHALYRVSLRLSQVADALPARPGHPRPTFVPILGSVGDRRLLDHHFAHYNPDVIYHAAAFKHVPLMEQNRFAVVANNVVGTHTLAMSALRHHVAKLVLVSTDKAVNPSSVMGASKRIAELVLLKMSTPNSRMVSIRLGNVLGSQGSVVPLFHQQIEDGGPVTVTDPEVRRYFVTLSQSVSRILEGACFNRTGQILVPDMGAPVKILGLAKKMIESAGRKDIRINYTGLRPGEKMAEELMSAEERSSAVREGEFSVVAGPCLPRGQLQSTIGELERATELYDEDRLICALRGLVPEYSSPIVVTR